MIVKTIKDKKVVTELKTLQAAEINGEVSISDIVVADPQLALNDEQAEELTATLKEDLTITYKIDTPAPDKKKDDAEAPVIKKENPAPAKAEEEVQVAVVDTGISDVSVPVKANKPVEQAPSQRVLQDEQKIEENPTEVVVQGKRVIDGANLQALQSATNTNVLMRDIRNIVTSHAHSNAGAVSISLNNLANSL